MSTPPIGALRARLTLETPVRTDDGGGGATVTWTAVADVWGGQRRDEGVVAGAVAHVREAAHLRADEERVDAAGGRGEVGVVQDETAAGPLVRAGVDDAVA